MMEVQFVLTVGVVVAIFATIGQCCDSAELGQPHKIASTAKVPAHVQVVWELKVTTGIVVYESDASKENKFPERYIATRTDLTIINVTKDDETGVFNHIVHGVKVYNCKLSVYKRAITPKCENLTLTENKIRTTCTTPQVYPQAKCQFTVQNGEKDRRIVADGTSNVTYNDIPTEPGRNEYYSTSCTLEYPVDGFKPGNLTVQVNMYPDLTGVSLDQGTIGDVGHPLQLSVPTASINPDNCPNGLPEEGNTNVKNGYIRQGKRASCMCNRAHVGNPSGKVEWSSSEGGTYAVLSHSDEAPVIQINLPDGPSSASLTFQRPGPIYLCPNQQTNIDITCEVPANSFSPTTVFTIRDGNSNILVNKVAGDDAWYASVNYNFTKSGQHLFTCRVENAVFSDIFSEAPASPVHVYAPPNSPPSLQVTGQYVITDNSETWVKQASHINVSCLTEGAYPEINSANVTVTCGGKSSSGQLSVSDVSGDKLKCQCDVDHETKTRCNGLTLYKEMTIHRAYGPSEVTLRFADDQYPDVQNGTLNMCSSGGRNLTVVCAVKLLDVNPELNINNFILEKHNAVSINEQLYAAEGSEYRSVIKLNVTSGGSHSLTCEARNPKFPDIKQFVSINIEVREPPRSFPKISARNSRNDDILVEGDDVTVTCNVLGGYPSVQSVTLNCGQDQSVTSNGTYAGLALNEIGLSYNETNCTCQATHVTGCYDLKSVLQLTVLMSNQTLSEQEDSPPIGAAVGGAIGAFVVIAVVVGGIFFLRRRMKKKERPCPEEGGYDPHQDPEAVIIDNELYATARQEQQVPVSAKDYTTIKPTMESATALPKKYNPENVDNPYEDVNPVKMDRKSLFKKSQTKPTPGAKPKIPKTSVKTDAVPKPGEQAQNNTDSEYATVAKTKPSHSKSSVHDETGDLTTVGATGGMPVVPVRLYDKDELKVSVNQQSASKGKQKKTKDKSAKKEKTKDKKKKNEKEKDTENDHIYSNETFDRSGDADVYANIAMGMKSTNDVDDGMHKNKDGLVYTTIVGVGSLKGAQRPVHHPRKEASVDYPDIDFNKIVANREDQD